nr:conserved oligomeric Golgi complex subunit 6-like [Quercus suber]POF15611.1 conserved oligomeric golgi complex subunit 6 [Quercus suber]
MAASYFQERTTSPVSTNGTFAVLSPSSPATAAAPRSNALQNRITTVLSASYADLDIRDTLAILDERGVRNSAETRRNLRLDIQQELIECNGEIVQDFARVADQLKRVRTAINSLNDSCAAIRKHVGAANRETGPMLDEAKVSLSDKQQVEMKQGILDAFKTHFIISDADLTSLTATSEPVNDDFFRVLTRVKKIHQDSQVLLGSENQRLGMEILEQSSRQLNAAFQKLYRWIQREFKSLDLENPQISSAIRRALRVLAERPTIFQNCLDFFAEARENILSNNFYAALTGAPLDQNHPVMGKAIELSAHDPLRYVSDMLAWAHSATVSEREALEVLFISEGDEIAKNIQAGIESEPWSRTGDDDEIPAFDGRTALSQLVDRDLAGVFRQLKQRTEQVIQSHQDAALAYKVSNLVTFYSHIFVTLLTEKSTILETLRPLADTAMRSFRSIMRDHVANLQAELVISSSDLSPPDFLLEGLDILQVLMKSYDTSAVHQDRAQRIAGFEPILHEALDPFLAGCENITKRLRNPNDHIFALNCLLATHDVLKRFPFADRTADMQPRRAAHESALIDTMRTWFLHESGLDALVDHITVPEDLNSSYANPARLAAIAQTLDAFLPTATDEARAYLGQLADPTLARNIIEQAAERFCEDFEDVEGVIMRADEARQGLVNGHGQRKENAADAASGDGDGVVLREVFPRTSDEIRVLLS